MPVGPVTKLRGVTAAQLDDALAALTAEDWRLIDECYVTPAAAIIEDYLGSALGVGEGIDAVHLLCRMYQHITASDPEV